MIKLLLRCFLFISSVIVLGCASSKIGQVEDTEEVPQDLPPEVQKELIEKFEVVEEPSQASEPSKKPEIQEKKKSQEVSKPFEYPKRRPEKMPFRVDEMLVFEITYFGMKAGDFTLRVLPEKELNKRKVMHFKGRAISSKVFSWFYRINDMVESYVDYEGLFSHRFHLTLDETKQTRDSLELNDSEKRQTFYWNRWNHKTKGYIETKEFKDIEPFPQDSLSALYYIRTLPLKMGEVYKFPVVSEGKTWEAVITVRKKEKLRTFMGRLETLVLSLDTKYQGVLKKKGATHLWITHDDRRIPLRLEAKVKIGSIVGMIKKVGHQADPGF